MATQTIRLRRAINLSDVFYDYETWPAWAKMSFDKKHKNRNERFKLFVFFWRNGMEPGTARRWVMIHDTYDKAAWESMEDLVQKTRTKHGTEYLERIPIYIFNSNRVEEYK